VSLEQAVSAEASRAAAQETVLASAISSEASRATAAEVSLRADLDSEVARASAAEAANGAAINTEKTRAMIAESGLSIAAAAEAASRTNADTTLNSRVDSEIERAQGAENVLTQAVAGEVINRQNAISAEASARSTEIASAMSELTGSASDHLNTLKEIGEYFSGADASIEAALTASITTATEAIEAVDDSKFDKTGGDVSRPVSATEMSAPSFKVGSTLALGPNWRIVFSGEQNTALEFQYSSVPFSSDDADWTKSSEMNACPFDFPL
jgi:hypothetical protein